MSKQESKSLVATMDQENKFSDFDIIIDQDQDLMVKQQNEPLTLTGVTFIKNQENGFQFTLDDFCNLINMLYKKACIVYPKDMRRARYRSIYTFVDPKWNLGRYYLAMISFHIYDSLMFTFCDQKKSFYDEDNRYIWDGSNAFIIKPPVHPYNIEFSWMNGFKHFCDFLEEKNLTYDVCKTMWTLIKNLGDEPKKNWWEEDFFKSNPDHSNQEKTNSCSCRSRSRCCF